MKYYIFLLLVFLQKTAWSISFTNTSGETIPVPFDPALLSEAMSRVPAGFTLAPTSQSNSFGVDISLSGAPQRAGNEWGQSDPRNAGEAFQYLAAACIIAPDYVADNGITIQERILQHLRCFIAGGNEWGCSGTGLSAQGYVAPVIGMTTVRTQLPDVWNQLTDEEKAKVDLLMRATLIGAHYATADANYDDYPNGVGRAPVLWATQSYRATTGVDQTGNYDRGWNLNHRVSVLTAIAAYYYFGPAAEAEGITRAAYSNRILATFVYDDFMSALLKAGFNNVHTVFSNAGGATEPDPALGNFDPYPVSLQRRTTSSSLYSPNGEYHYFGSPLSKIGQWFEEFINGSMNGPVRPYGGDSQHPELTSDESRPFGYPGNSNPSGDNLLNFPNLGAPGSQMEFDTSDAGRATGNDQAASGARSSLGYVSGGLPYMMTAFNMLNLYDSVDPNTGLIAGITADDYAEMLVMANVGLEDYLYKVRTGYASYAHSNRGNMSSVNANPPARVQYQLDIWNNVVDRPVDKISAVNSAKTVPEMRAALEDKSLALILYQYNGLSNAGKNVAAAAMIAAAQANPFYFKKDIQSTLNPAVWDAAVVDFNVLLAATGTTAQDVLTKLSVNLTSSRNVAQGAYVPNDGRPNALGIFVYGFSDFYAYNNPDGRQLRLNVAEHILKTAPTGGFADRRAIRDAVIAAIKMNSPAW